MRGVERLHKQLLAQAPSLGYMLQILQLLGHYLSVLKIQFGSHNLLV